MRKKGNVLNAPNTLTIYEDSKIDPANVQRNTATSTRQDQESMYAAGPKPSRGVHMDDFMNNAGGSMQKLPSNGPLTVKLGGYEESQAGSPRTLRKLPASIADGGVD